ncbi:DUF3083 family protein [Shewanella morhuae]|uniref:Protein of uncharacterized function (DUF3083) n=1 Tax=Shewanella morhuae TaxID=365591 RepID=A0A380A4Y8_9GAMM|nr:DUF3083 family protein [Shewanella morhuae]SUI73668.1 Protein of uncharacterised function (DUF3083) [Shewanella morhuae]
MSLSHQQKVYLPKEARTKQFITAEIKVTDALLSQYPDYQTCYQSLSRLVFNLAEQHDLRNVHVITNDKLPVVRFHTEAYCFQTTEQILFFYNPAYHEAQNLFTQENYRARKLRIVFLATGESIRSNSASFHTRVREFLNQLMPKLPISDLKVKIRDHQHLSYDLFAKSKGYKETYGYKLRAIEPRYKARKCELPENVSSLTYVTVSLPLSRRLKQGLLPDSATDFTPLYQHLEDSFLKAAAGKQLTRLAMIANGLTPLVRNSKFEKLDSKTEVQMIGFDPNALEQQVICNWDADNLVEEAHFIIVAGTKDADDVGFGRFMNNVEAALKTFAADIDVEPEREDLIIRFHQHISYQI